MTLQDKVMEQLKDAMRAKDALALQALRAIKSALLLEQTSAGASGALAEDVELKLLQRLVKQRKDAAAMYQEQGREDLAATEFQEVAVIERFLPAQLTAEEVAVHIKNIISELGATSIKDMGKVMAAANQALAGQAEGKLIAEQVKTLLA
ncbi:MAG: GatB/YqeY domain-containing protein [Flavobacteriaceae bacterium]|jgi:uncharacterized protein YqeY